MIMPNCQLCVASGRCTKTLLRLRHMRLLILSDVHADVAALERTLTAAEPLGWDGAVLLGDLIGYGSEPLETLRRLEGLNVHARVLGNHEYMLSQLHAGAQLQLPPQVLRPLELCLEQFSEAELTALTGMEDSLVTADWQAVHGSPGARFDYLLSSVAARRAERHLERDLCLIGHTHLPGVFLQDEAGRWRHRPARLVSQSWTLEPGRRYFLNPGSVATNRDPQAGGSFGLLDLAEDRKSTRLNSSHVAISY